MSLAAVSCSTNFTNQLALSLTVIEDRGCVSGKNKFFVFYFVLHSTCTIFAEET